jgi:type VI secretion system FHA domain protein
MPLRLEIVSDQKRALGERGVKEFGLDGGVIGRSLESDWVLPDPDRFMSSKHASIDNRSGSYYIVDTSTNGVYVNDAEIPVGRGKPQRLFSGDRLRFGDYQLLVVIDDDDTLGDALKTGEHIDPVSSAQQVEGPDLTTNDLIGITEITGSVEIADLVEEDALADDLRREGELAALNLELEPEPTETTVVDPEPEPKPSPAPKAVRQLKKASAKSAPAKQKPKGKPSTSSSSTDIPAADSGAAVDFKPFFRAAGLDYQPLDAQQTTLLLQRLGQITREVVLGITETLHQRAEQKNTLRLAHTTIQPNNNNPLKFAAGVDEALHNLLFKNTNAYLSASDAIRESFADVRTHQHALLSAVFVAFMDFIERLDPEELQNKFDRGMKRGAILGAANKMKYWDLYTELYQVMTQHPPGQFPHLFAEELSRAYEAAAESGGESKAVEPAKRVPAA